MADICAFEGNCPMGDDIIEISGACTEERGKMCGKVAAYGMLMGQYDGLNDLDDASPIEGVFTITKVPDGVPPQEVREEWVGVELPVRNIERGQAQDEVEVSPADAIISLLRSGRLDAAEWFAASGIPLEMFGGTWVFRATDGSVQTVPEITSEEYYGASLSAATREALEQ